jgi:rhodanese-related sulfurtransferase
MADRWRAPGGWTVEVVRLSLTPDRHDGEWIRLKQFGAFHADVRTPAEVERWVPLADLEQDTLALAA